MQVLADGERMRAVMQRHLVAAAGLPYLIHECRVANMRRRDGSRGTAQYDLLLEDPASGRAWEQQVSAVLYGGARARRVWAALPPREASAAGASQPALPPFAFVPELDLLLQVFPHDARLLGLARVMSGPTPEIATALTASMGPSNWRLTAWHAEPVQYRVDMRAILRLTVRATDASSGREEQREFYVKIYRDQAEAQRSQRGQRAVYDAIATSRAALNVATPVVYAPEIRALVTSALPGTSLSKILRWGEGRVGAVRAAARAVAAFHRLDVAAPPRSFADELARLREAETVLAAARPDLAADVSAMLDALIAGLADAPAALIHGDLKPDHILFDGERVALIDFDLIGAADPVVDVAHILSFLDKAEERARTPIAEEETAARLFVDEYFAHVPGSWRARLPLHHAMTSIHKAAGLTRRGGGRRDQIEGVLREGQAILAGDGEPVPSFRRRLTRPTVH